MKLKPRLAAIASFIPAGSVVADIGTDHAYLPIYLALNNIASRVIAVEKEKVPYAKAAEAVSVFNQAHKIEIRRGDGLRALNDDDQVDAVVIAGIGGRSLCRILISGKDRLKKTEKIILQPMGEVALVRRLLASSGLRIEAEKVAEEGGSYYEILAVTHGRQRIDDPFLLEIGPKLVESRDPLLVPFLESKINRYNRVLDGLNCSRRDENTGRKTYYKEKLSRLQEVLELVRQGGEDN